MGDVNAGGPFRVGAWRKKTARYKSTRGAWTNPEGFAFSGGFGSAKRHDRKPHAMFFFLVW
jgi:hypothetical protein